MMNIEEVRIKNSSGNLVVRKSGKFDSGIVNILYFYNNNMSGCSIAYYEIRDVDGSIKAELREIHDRLITTELDSDAVMMDAIRAGREMANQIVKEICMEIHTEEPIPEQYHYPVESGQPEIVFCKDCIYFDEFTEQGKDGLCKLYPPVLHSVLEFNPSTKLYYIYHEHKQSLVYEDTGCGQGRRKGVKS